MHHPGSIRKSGKNLWKMWTGFSVLSGTQRREWRTRKMPYILDGVPQFPRSCESALIDSGLETRRTAPTTDLKYE